MLHRLSSVRFLQSSHGWRASVVAGLFLLVLSPRLQAVDGFATINGDTTGGAGGPTVTVTNGTDFITQINTAGPRIIQVQGPISIGRSFTTANKTILGLGTNATLMGNLNISDTTNVIIQNLHITYNGDDGLTIWNAQHVWVDHCTFFDCDDGSCDMSRGSAYVTVSWCKFHYPTQTAHRFTMIADGYVNGGVTNQGWYTLHHNWWSAGSDQRMPASSYGRIHMYNNYFSCTNNSYCSNARAGTEFVSENNYYAGVKNPIYADAGTTGLIKTSGNIYTGTYGTAPAPGTDVVSMYPLPYAYTLDDTAGVPAIVQAGAGAEGPDIIPIPPKIWDGGGSGNNWNTANNWGLNEVPKIYDTLTFAGTTRLAPNNNFTSGSEFPSLNFTNDAGAFVVGGNSIGLGVGIADDSTAVQTVNLNMDFTYGAHHYPTNRIFTVSQPTGSLILNGRLSGGTSNYIFSLIKRGDGLLVLNGTNTFVGPVVLDGGTLQFSALATNLPGSLAAGTNLIFNGGALQWAPGNNDDISVRSVTFLAGGATFDVGANDVVFASPLGINGSGGLTKSGTGHLTLNGNNTYVGNTLISAGTLALGSAGTLPNSPQVILSNNAALDVSGRSDHTLSLGSGKSLVGNGSVLGSVVATSGSTVSPGLSIGSLTITNSLTLQPGCTTRMELDAAAQTNDVIQGLATLSCSGTLILTNLSGSLTAGDSFKLFSASSYSGSFNSIQWPELNAGLAWTNKIATDGSIAVVSLVNTTPTNLVLTATNGGLLLSWPADHTGWHLQAQTNSVGAGLGTNWVDVSGSTATNLVFLPINPANGSVFLRLKYP